MHDVDLQLSAQQLAGLIILTESATGDDIGAAAVALRATLKNFVTAAGKNSTFNPDDYQLSIDDMAKAADNLSKVANDFDQPDDEEDDDPVESSRESSFGPVPRRRAPECLDLSD